MRNITSNMKRFVAIAAIGAAVVLTAPVASASPGSGGAGSSTTGPLGHGVSGSGAWYVATGGQTLTVPFECNAIATGPAGFTGIRPPDQGGCVLMRNGAKASGAPGIGVPITVAATAALGQIPLLNTTSVQTCWRAYAAYNNGDLIEDANCSTLTIL